MRLKELKIPDINYTISVFQFQTGAIKSHAIFRRDLQTVLRFNSKLVRLKDEIYIITAEDFDRFQFQTGAIKRLTSF